MHVIDAAMFKAMIRSGAMDLKRHCEEVNSLNVFPVPDGDTGVNMLATMDGGVEAVSSVSADSLGECCKALSRGMLLAARGNSGVILSQFFAGLSDSLAPFEQANVLQFGQAFEAGVKRAYEVVVKPVEGTILTVMRIGSQKTMEGLNSTTSFEEYFRDLALNMKTVLNKTPDLLPVLKEAGVIDSGGAGLLYIIEGMGQALGGKLIEEVSFNMGGRHRGITEEPMPAFDENSVLDYGYCTEFILQLTKDKGGVDAFSLEEAIAYLSSIGDSLVAFRDRTLVKVHVHTKTPDKAIAYALRYGEFVRFKMENMTLQHNQTLVDKSRSIASMVIPSEAKKPLASVAVSPTAEVSEIFETYGVTVTINVGSLLNPGTEDFVEAFKKANAKDIIVFPNNKNEIMVAEMAASLFTEANIHIVPTHDIAQGIACCSVIDIIDISLEDNLSRAEAALAKDKTIGIVRAVRDSGYHGKKIRKGDFLCMGQDRDFVSAPSLNDAFARWLEGVGLSEASLFTVIYGKGVSSSDRAAIEELVSDRFDFVEVQSYEGGDCMFDLYAILE